MLEEQHRFSISPSPDEKFECMMKHSNVSNYSKHINQMTRHAVHQPSTRPVPDSIHAFDIFSIPIPIALLTPSVPIPSNSISPPNVHQTIQLLPSQQQKRIDGCYMGEWRQRKRTGKRKGRLDVRCTIPFPPTHSSFERTERSDKETYKSSSSLWTARQRTTQRGISKM